MDFETIAKAAQAALAEMESLVGPDATSEEIETQIDGGYAKLSHQLLLAEEWLSEEEMVNLYDLLGFERNDEEEMVNPQEWLRRRYKPLDVNKLKSILEGQQPPLLDPPGEGSHNTQ